MSTKRQSQFLAAAYEVLSKARRSMHYTQITSVGQRLGILQSASPSIEISMSSLLSEDIRINPDSLFVRERPGVYALSPKGLVGTPNMENHHPNTDALLDHLHVLTGIADRNALVNKALYLAGRTLDVAGESGVSLYKSPNVSQSIEINIPDLVREFVAKKDDRRLALISTGSQATLNKSKTIARRLTVEDLPLAVRVSLFLLELAIDLVGTDNLLVIMSTTSSIKLPVRTGRQNDS